MASSDSNEKFANYTSNWKVEWSQYEKIRNSSTWPRQFFFTAFNNVLFQWSTYLHVQKPYPTSKECEQQIRFCIQYTGGPLETIKGVTFNLGIVKCDGSVLNIANARVAADYGRGQEGCHFYVITANNSAYIRTKYGLQATDSLVFNITMRIPIESISYAPTATPKFVPHADRFRSIQNPESSQFSDVVFLSHTDVKFYCHKIIVGQTEPLQTILRGPLTVYEYKQPPLKGRTFDGYKFKEMATSTLKAMIEYLYTGQSTLNGLTVTEIVGVANAADQYLLKPLKELCVAYLWKRVVDKPESAFEIARFANLHDDCIHLKHRAYDVIVENYQDLNINPILLPKRFGGTRGEELRGELINYMAQRRCPYFGPW